MPGRALGKERALRQEHKGQQAVEGAQRNDEVQATQPVPLLVVPPGEPRQQKGQPVQRGSVQNRELAPCAALQLRVVLYVPKQGVIDGVPDHEHNLPQTRGSVTTVILLRRFTQTQHIYLIQISIQTINT